MLLGDKVFEAGLVQHIRIKALRSGSADGDTLQVTKNVSFVGNCLSGKFGIRLSPALAVYICGKRVGGVDI